MTDQLLRGRRQMTPHLYVTGTRQMLTNVHGPSDCEGRSCCIHEPSRHPLINAPTHWRVGYYRGDLLFGEIMERICPCGLFHPDPDDIAFVIQSRGAIVAEMLLEHQCCGCCEEEF